MLLTFSQVYTELVRPSSPPHLENHDPLNQSTLFLQSDKSADDDSPASIFGHNMDEASTSLMLELTDS